MPTIDISVTCPIYPSFRVQQVAGLFDVPLTDRLTERFSLVLPELDQTWRVGLIVGPSGSGKSTVARQWFGPNLIDQQPWPADRAVIDGFGELPTRRITQLLTAVGFSSPPSWLKPYGVLSNGERFRCDLARALSRNVLASATTSPSVVTTATAEQPLVVVDEFTSVVDRTVAQIGSAAVSRALRSDQIPGQFVAVTCHDDVAEWLTPDWILDMSTQEFTRRSLRRPSIELELSRCHYRTWSLFKRHHYLSGSLSHAARCYLATWQGRPVAFVAVLAIIGQQQHWRITRLVTLPDFQGLGIGMRVAEAVAQLYTSQGLRMNITGSHPAVIAHCQRSPDWRVVRVSKTGSRRPMHYKPNYCGSVGRAVVSFEFVLG